MRSEGRRFVDLTESNPTRAGFEYPRDLLKRLADPCGLTYQPSPFGSSDARAAVAREYHRRGIAVDQDQIVLTSSTSEAYGFLFKLLADPDDEVLVPRPSYPLFDHLARLELVTARAYDLDIDAAWRIEFESIEAALGDRTRALLVVSPNNPTGSVVSAEDVARLESLCAERRLPLIADEVFADFPLSAASNEGTGVVAKAKDVLAFSLGGLSKSIGLPQAKLAWMAVTGPDDLVRAALDRLELVCDTYLSVSTPVQVAAAELLERGAGVREQIVRRVRANHQTLLGRTASVPACRVLPSVAGWQAVLQVPSFQSEESLVVDLLLKENVLTHPGYFFDFPRESYLVVSLLAPEAHFAGAVDSILRHVERTAGGHD
jgi:hypothetical protein